MSSVAERIKEARISRGLGHKEMADALAMNLPSYFDLESCDEEWKTVADLSQIVTLAEKLEVPLFTLIGEDVSGVAPMAFRELAEQMVAGFASGTLKKDELSWDVDEFLEVPEIAQEYPIMFLRDLSLEVGFDWRAPIVWLQKKRKT